MVIKMKNNYYRNKQYKIKKYKYIRCYYACRLI